MEGHGLAANDDVIDTEAIEGRAEFRERCRWRPPSSHAYSSGEVTTDGSHLNVRLSV